MPGQGGRLRLPSLGTDSSSGGNSVSQLQKEHRRVVMMGSAKVGKSSIISQFLYDKYLSKYRETVEELHRGEYVLPDGASLTLDILDTSGAYQFPAMRALSISTADAFILVFAVDNAASWEEIKILREQVGWYKPDEILFLILRLVQRGRTGALGKTDAFFGVLNRHLTCLRAVADLNYQKLRKIKRSRGQINSCRVSPLEKQFGHGFITDGYKKERNVPFLCVEGLLFMKGAPPPAGQIIEARGYKIPIVVVGNKIDLESKRVVPRELSESTAAFDWECGYIECSAKDNTNIIDVFKELLVQAKIRYNLSPAVRRRRQSLPNYTTGNSAKSKYMLKRNSCTVA